MNNKLILRAINSPWVTQPIDVTKGSVLTHVELDGNFIYLKGEVVNGLVLDNKTLKINKINGSEVSVDLSTLSTNVLDLVVTGGTYDVNTGVVTFSNTSNQEFQVSGFTSGITDTFINSGTLSSDTLTLSNTAGNDISISGFSGLIDQNNLVSLLTLNLNTFADSAVTVVDKFNSQPRFVDDKTNLVVKTIAGPFRTTPYITETTYLFTPGKGNYGSGSIIVPGGGGVVLGQNVTINNFIEISSKRLNNVVPNPVVYNPDAIVYKITVPVFNEVHNIVNNSPSTYTINNIDDVYFEITFNNLKYIYRYVGTQPKVLGSGGFPSTSNDYVEFYTPTSNSVDYWVSGDLNSTGSTKNINTSTGGSDNTILSNDSMIHSKNSTLGKNANNSAIIGGVGITGNTSNTIYVPNLNIDVKPTLNNGADRFLTRNPLTKMVEEVELVTSTTYVGLSTLVNNNQLVVGKKYILTDYRSIYTINGSDSSDIVSKHEIVGYVSGFANFNKTISSDLLNTGETAVVDSLPSGYTGTINVGDVITVTNYFNSQYLMFNISPPIGSYIRINKQRYANVPSDSVVNDSNGKPILKPGGVRNIEVHDGLAYGDLLASENPLVGTEIISLTAISDNKFSRFAESLTYIGDTLEYDFDDNKLTNDNGEVINGESRNGFILKRSNNKLNISVDKDWRVQRYRRYKMDNTNWSSYILNNPLYIDSGVNHFSSTNTGNIETHKYLLKGPSVPNFYIDLTKKGPNPFLSGVTHDLVISGGGYFPGNFLDVSVGVDLPFSAVTNFKDFFIFPLENNNPTEIVSKFVVGKLENSVFKDYNNTYGRSGVIEVDILGGLIEGSFMSGSRITAGQITLSKINAIDSFDLTCNSIAGETMSQVVSNLNVLSYIELSVNGSLNRVTFGGKTNETRNNSARYYFDSSSSLINTIIGSRRVDEGQFIGVVSSHCLFNMGYERFCSLSGKMYLTNLKFNLPHTYQNVSVHLDTYQTKLLNKSDYGYMYNINAIPIGVKVNNKNDKQDLLEMKIDSNYNISLINHSTQQ